MISGIRGSMIFRIGGTGAEDVYQGTNETRVSLDTEGRTRPTAPNESTKNGGAFKKNGSSVGY
jgi:hypothetical protein